MVGKSEGKERAFNDGETSSLYFWERSSPLGN